MIRCKSIQREAVSSRHWFRFIYFGKSKGEIIDLFAMAESHCGLVNITLNFLQKNQLSCLKFDKTLIDPQTAEGLHRNVENVDYPISVLSGCWRTPS